MSRSIKNIDELFNEKIRSPSRPRSSYPRPESGSSSDANRQTAVVPISLREAELNDLDAFCTRVGKARNDVLEAAIRLAVKHAGRQSYYDDLTENKAQRLYRTNVRIDPHLKEALSKVSSNECCTRITLVRAGLRELMYVDQQISLNPEGIEIDI